MVRAGTVDKTERMEIEHYQKGSDGTIYHRIEYKEDRGNGLELVKEVSISPK